MINAKFIDCFNRSTKDDRNAVSKKKLSDFLDAQYFKAKVQDVTIGSAVTRYIVLPESNYIKCFLAEQKRFIQFFDNNELRMFQDGKHICIEVPNKYRCTYGFTDCISALQQLPDDEDKLNISIGELLDGSNLTYDLTTMPHLLVAGETGSGKSVLIHNILLSLLLQYPKDRLNLLLIDPKEVELSFYRNCPQTRDVVTHTDLACRRLRELCDEMDNRYNIFAEHSCRDILSYNKIAKVKMPRIVVVIEELADLTISEGEDVIKDITRLVVKARAAGIHVILATQRPDADFVTSKLRSNFQCRISFTTADYHNSRVILGRSGAEKLRGKGDGLFKTNNGQTLIRFQTALITEDEIMKAVKMLQE